MSNLVFFGAVGVFGWGFHQVNKALNSYPVPSVSTAKSKWANIATSLVHASLVTALLFISLFTESSILSSDLRLQYSPITLAVVILSAGYFVYDTLDICVNKDMQRVYLLIHHFVIMLCFFISLWTGEYISFCAYGLLLEINSVFLHTRQLLLFAGVSKLSRVFVITASMNFLTFLMFRFTTLTWLAYWIYVHQDEVPQSLAYLGYVGIVLLNLLNFGLLRRLYASDAKFLWNRKEQLKLSGKSGDSQDIFWPNADEKSQNEDDSANSAKD